MSVIFNGELVSGIGVFRVAKLIGCPETSITNLIVKAAYGGKQVSSITNRDFKSAFEIAACDGYDSSKDGELIEGAEPYWNIYNENSPINLIINKTNNIIPKLKQVNGNKATISSVGYCNLATFEGYLDSIKYGLSMSITYYSGYERENYNIKGQINFGQLNLKQPLIDSNVSNTNLDLLMYIKGKYNNVDKEFYFIIKRDYTGPINNDITFDFWLDTPPFPDVREFEVVNFRLLSNATYSNLPSKPSSSSYESGNIILPKLNLPIPVERKSMIEWIIEATFYNIENDYKVYVSSLNQDPLPFNIQIFVDYIDSTGDQLSESVHLTPENQQGEYIYLPNFSAFRGDSIYLERNDLVHHQYYFNLKRLLDER